MNCILCKEKRKLYDSIYCFDCKNPEVFVVPPKKRMKCLGQIAVDCVGTFLTTPDRRICCRCTPIIAMRWGIETESASSNIGQRGNRQLRAKAGAQ